METSRTTVSDILSKCHETGGVKERAGRGRKRVITEEDEKKFVKKAKREKPATQIAREYKAETGISISERRVQQIIHKHGLRWLVNEKVEEISELNKAARLNYATEMRNYNWKKSPFLRREDVLYRFADDSFLANSWKAQKTPFQTPTQPSF